ncbi:MULTISPECIES: hypothetical protein [Pseudomonas]|uniref:hypothetical protein n=1 Tax=Pseudomonas TaxID=286 RepID=UPI001319DA9A|nr:MULTISPECIES: hypothetical protein [Pseudomonas]NWD88139.1 hypothetical protein [Pseudomonas sp. K5002]QQD52611.1 hypothetical protein MHB_0021010 [Pseudomonas fluorescens BBc6R8]
MTAVLVRVAFTCHFKEQDCNAAAFGQHFFAWHLIQEVSAVITGYQLQKMLNRRASAGPDTLKCVGDKSFQLITRAMDNYILTLNERNTPGRCTTHGVDHRTPHPQFMAAQMRAINIQPGNLK